MYRVRVKQNSTKEEYSIIVFDFEELQAMINYVKLKFEELELLSIQRDCVYIGLDTFKTILESNEVK